jgi:hypothetical protein
LKRLEITIIRNQLQSLSIAQRRDNLVIAINIAFRKHIHQVVYVQ